MKEYAINFEGRSNAISINQLENTTLFSLFSNYSGQIIDMYRLVVTLNNNGFQVNQVINNSNNTIYSIYSNQMNIVLSLSISKDIEYQQKNKERYEPTIKLLKTMGKNASVINNNITNISSFQNSESEDLFSDEYKPNLKLIKGTKYNPSIKKIFKNKKKLAIALITLTAAATAIGFGVYAVNELVETQKYLNENSKYSYQNNQSSDNINQQRQLYQAIQNGEVDTSLANPNEYIEEMKTEYNEQNYQNVR